MKPVLLWLGTVAALIAALLAWYVWLPALLVVLLVRHWLRPEGDKVTARNLAKAKANQRAHRIRTALQMQLAAHGLTDTPLHRAQMLQALAQDSKRP